MKNRKNNKSAVAAAIKGAALLGTCAVSSQLHALVWEFGEFELNLDTTLGYTAQWRTESRDSEIVANPDGNDGDNNFDPGLISNAGTVILEFGGVYKDFSFFFRGDALYDHVYNQRSDLSEAAYPTYNNGIPAGGALERGEYPDPTIDEHGKRVRMLDAFVTYQFNAGNQGGGVRLGRQVISWGEATFYRGVNALQNPIDAVVAQSPGVEARTLFLPTSAIDLKWDFTTNIGAEVYYKFEWERSTIPGVGSYFSTNDVTGPGAERILQAGVERGKTVTPGNDGQWGIAGRYVTDGGTNFELYYVKAHANVPGVTITLGKDYNQIYADDITTWAGSFSTNLGEAQVYADVAYSPNMPVVDRNITTTPEGLVVSDITRATNWQVVAGFTDLYTAFPWLSEQITLLAEVIYSYTNAGESDLDTSGYLTTNESWGYQGRMILSYFAVFSGLDLQVPISFKHDLGGYGNAIGYNGLTEDVKQAGLGVDAFYLTNWQFALKYAWFWGDENGIRDRDNVALTAKYIF